MVNTDKHFLVDSGHISSEAAVHIEENGWSLFKYFRISVLLYSR